jgi:LytS/YehU family sensor histidine kinase
MHTKNRLSIISILQIAFWIIYALLSVYTFSQTASITDSVKRIALVLPLQILLFYTCYLYLIPLYFEKKRFALFYLFLFVVVAIVTIARLFIKKIFIDSINTGGIELSENIQISIIVISELLIVLISCLLAVAKEKYEYEKRYQQTQTKFLESELNLLKSQVSPHFLLNTLNNIYSFAIANAPETPDAIFKLSEILKYFLYESSHKKITISREIDIIHAYIDLYKLKFNEALNIKTDFNIDEEQQQIEPLLLISLVENTFKHSGIGLHDDAYIKMEATVKNDRFVFCTSNSIFDANKTISKRLVLNYPDNHTFLITQNELHFSVKIEIPFL